MLEDLGGKGGVYSLGVGIPLEGRRTGVRGGVLCRDWVKATLDSQGRGGSVFRTNT